VKKGCLVLTGLLVFLIVISLFLALVQKSIPLGSKIALVRIEGPIFDSKDIVDEIKEYTKHASIKAIILRIDSPGGAVAPSQEIYEAVKKASEKKKIVVSMGSIAASGGYYIAAPSSKIIANPGTLTGSIGVILEIPNLEGLMSKIGIKTEVIKSGQYKDMVSYFRSMKKEEREILQGVMDNVHEQFIRAVSEARNLKMDEVKKIADGRIFTGEQAVQHGLVDELGTLEDAIMIAGKLTGIKGEPKVVTKEEKDSFFDILRNKFSGKISDVFPTLQIKYLYVP
jgi:protease-4